MSMRSRVNQEQMTKLLDLINRRGNLVKGRITYTTTNKQDFWKSIAAQLNAVDGGVYKNTWKWCKMWQDWKTKTKKKADVLLRRKELTYGQPAALSSLELRLLRMIDYPIDDKRGILEMAAVSKVEIPEADNISYLSEDMDAPTDLNDDGDKSGDESSDSETEKSTNKGKSSKKRKVSLEEFRVRTTLSLEKEKVQQKSEELRLRALELKLKAEELKMQENEMNKITYLTNIEEEKLKCFKDISISLKELVERTKNGNVGFHVL